MSEPAGRLIAFEGVDGCGKSTQARLLADALGAVLTHEPGATPLGAALRRMVLGDPSAHASIGDHFDPVARAEALLLAADKAQHVTEVIRPALRAGRWVVTDRYAASTLAYQGYGHGLPQAALARIVDWAVDGQAPDLTVLVDVPLDVARSRMSTTPDRLERMDEGFFARVRSGYRQMADGDPERWVVIDGAQPEETVATAVLTAVQARMGEESGTDRRP